MQCCGAWVSLKLLLWELRSWFFLRGQGCSWGLSCWVVASAAAAAFSCGVCRVPMCIEDSYCALHAVFI
jgi:hypothetical protein